jgi:hypothetical protein
MKLACPSWWEASLVWVPPGENLLWDFRYILIVLKFYEILLPGSGLSDISIVRVKNVMKHGSL